MTGLLTILAAVTITGCAGGGGEEQWYKRRKWGRVPPDIFHWEIFWPTGKKGQGRKENGEEKKENLKRKRVENWKWKEKVWKWAEDGFEIISLHTF